MPESAMDLPDGAEVHVWLADLDRPPLERSLLADTLAQDERARAARFVHHATREHFAMGRGLLRMLLAGYLGTRPSEIGLSYGPFGKPFVADHPELSFNVSASGPHFMAGFSRAPIGVDIERLRPMEDMLDVAERFFAPGESRALRGMPPALRQRGFFNCWTRKEAYVKAMGGGLSIPLDGFEVSLGEPAELRAADPPGGSAAWTMFALAPTPSTVAAVAVQAAAGALVEKRWSDLA